MRTRTKATLVLILVLALAAVIPVAAQDAPPPCEGENVHGIVVLVGEETVTIDTGEGLCTVELDSDYGHPIVGLLGAYFGDVSTGDLGEALGGTQGCAVQDPDTEKWTWADCETEGAVEVTVTGQVEGQPCTFTAEMDGQQVTVTVDDLTVCEGLAEDLSALDVGWDLDEDGTVFQAGDEIDAYHEAGYGFGVLVKLYAIAAASQEACAGVEDPCGVTVEELIAAFQSGVGLGELFAEYGRPSLRGVGHVRHADDGESNDKGKPEHAGPKPKTEGGSGKPEHAGPKPKKKK